jgi:ubiquinol-cytochrome c reductase cytochrome b subunit
VGAATLSRFFSIHYLLPFLIAGIVVIHLAYLHEVGSSNPFYLEHREINQFYIFFYPYFFIKDFLGILILFLVFSIFLFYSPNFLGHSDNYIEANPLVTPEHIVPE